MCVGTINPEPASKRPAVFLLEFGPILIGEFAMGERTDSQQAGREEPGSRAKTIKPATWKHPDDGTGFPSVDQERPLEA